MPGIFAWNSPTFLRMVKTAVRPQSRAEPSKSKSSAETLGSFVAPSLVVAVAHVCLLGLRNEGPAEAGYRSLRAMGLPSLVHRRQIQHGQIAAPFFVWKHYQAQKSSRETAARLRPQFAGTAAFSPSPEAVAIPSS